MNISNEFPFLDDYSLFGEGGGNMFVITFLFWICLEGGGNMFVITQVCVVLHIVIRYG